MLLAALLATGCRDKSASPGMHYVGWTMVDPTPDVWVLRDDERGVTCWLTGDHGGIHCLRDGEDRRVPR